MDGELIAHIAEIAYQQKWIARAPLPSILCTVGVDDLRGGRDIQQDRFLEYAEAIAQMDQDLYWALNQEEHQTKIAGTHMALAALEYGVGSCWVSRFEVKRLIAQNTPAPGGGVRPLALRDRGEDWPAPSALRRRCNPDS